MDIRSRVQSLKEIFQTVLIDELLYDDIKFPSKLYHYTSLDGVIGILQNRTIYASNAMFLNDPTEIVYGQKLIKEAITNIVQNKDFQTTYYGGFGSQEVEILQSALNVIDNVNINNTFVSCFTSQSDMLSQWRGYANGGVRLGFNRDKLLDSIIDSGFYLHRVDYNRSSQVIFIEKIIGSLLTYLLVESDDYLSVFDGKTIMELDRDIIPQALVEILMSNIRHYKDCGFKEEREYRLIRNSQDIETDKAHKTKYRSNGKFIVPYSELKFKNPIPITDIVVGPSPFSDKLKLGLELLLESEGYKCVKVKLSSIPYIP